MDSTLTETVYRLDLRDPEQSRGRGAAARGEAGRGAPASARRSPPSASGSPSHGTIERTVSSVSDDTRGVSGSVRGGWKFGGGVKRIKVHRELVSASARVGGFERARQDCQASR